jgi:glycine dehydrogenase subunit 1
MAYISNTEKEKKEMLDIIGVSDFAQLIENIPETLRINGEMNLDPPLSELELGRQIGDIAAKNTTICEANSFLGGGVYDHFIPAAIDTILSRPEFYTAYTPYQAEVSQGTLQAIYEYQTLICELTGMDISNAGMYDGASATAEAILMATRKNRLPKALISTTLNPRYIDIVRIYTEGAGIQIEMIPSSDGVTDTKALSDMMDEQVCCVLIQNPNYFGCIEDCEQVQQIVRTQKKALFIPIVNPISLALLNAPSEYGADIVVGEAQSLGNKPYFGGPLLGFLTSTIDLSRNIPGRVVGETTDTDGKRAFSLTLQAREQHIRRDKATSNICSNEALCALASTVYMCLMGKTGLRKVAELCTTKAHYLAAEISKIPGFALSFDKPFFHEFAIDTPISPQEIIETLQIQNIFPGIDLSDTGYENKLLVAVTEKKTKNDMDQLVTALKNLVKGGHHE